MVIELITKFVKAWANELCQFFFLLGNAFFSLWYLV